MSFYLMTNKNFQSIPIPMKKRRGGIPLSTLPSLVNIIWKMFCSELIVFVDIVSIHPQMLNSVTKVTTSN